MRDRYFSILYLFVLLFYLIRPSLPYLEYIINKDYIEKFLCIQKDNPDNECHGKCYLHEQLNKQSELPDSRGNDDNKIVPDNKLDDHLRSFLQIPDLYANVTGQTYHYSVLNMVKVISDIFVPPEK